MRIHIINPNTTADLSALDLAAAEAVAAPGTTVTVSEPRDGVPSIESSFDEAIGAIGALAEIARLRDEEIDAFVIACFGDTGLAAAREAAAVPAVGMTEAALMAAALVAQTFSIVTLPARTRLHAHRVVANLGLGLAGRCLPIRAVDLPVLHGDADEAAVRDLLTAEARRAVAEGAEAIVLGCAGIGHLAQPMQAALGVPVIDGVASAVGMAEMLVRCRLPTSRASTFAAPPDKPLGPGFTHLTGRATGC
ncbi:aspartate/glutamate racemase family protein [Oceaniglobus roseus]|uniref:aspartate/glutamate racemase family protein n=1 Tax=Oceaniglobus roseus TaxID=1737570 RepID=UPI000C7F29D9|nr:aspartate/glutamate racemase family protein [Kandeliimicrobium roseum]